MGHGRIVINASRKEALEKVGTWPLTESRANANSVRHRIWFSHAKRTGQGRDIQKQLDCQAGLRTKSRIDRAHSQGTLHMPIRLFPIRRPLCLLALTAMSLPAVSQSLQERRLSLIKGTAPGIVIIDLDSSKPSATPQPENTGGEAKPKPVAGTGSGSATGTTTAVAPSSPKSGFLSTLPPPTGRPMNATGRVDTPDRGVALRTKDTTTKSQAEPEAKP